MKERGKQIIWPNYLDSTKTRKEGRKLAKKIAVESPKLQEIETAARVIRLNPTANPNATHPRTRWEKKGCVIIDKQYSKLKVLRSIAEKIRELRKSK